MKGISERLWMLIGILIGFYGNWYFNLLTKLEETQDVTLWLIWVLSAISLFMFCTEIVHWKKTIKSIKGIDIRLSFVLAITHLTTIFLLVNTITGLTLFAWTGIALWSLVAFNESKIYYLTEF